MPRANRGPDPSLRTLRIRLLPPRRPDTAFRDLAAIPCTTDLPEDVFLWADPGVSPELIMRAIKRIKSQQHYAKPEAKAAKAERDRVYRSTRRDSDAEPINEPLPISENQKRLRLVWANGKYDLRRV